MSRFHCKINTKALDFLEFETDFGKSKWREYCKNNNGKRLVIEDVKNAPSEELRGYYFGAVIPTVKNTVKEWDALGDDDVHEILKKLFNYFDFHNPITKRIERVGRSAMSSDSSTVRAMEFLEKIRLWLAEDFMVELPNPQEYKKKLDEVVMIDETK